jgi:hypothetical protein
MGLFRAGIVLLVGFFTLNFINGDQKLISALPYVDEKLKQILKTHACSITIIIIALTQLLM